MFARRLCSLGLLSALALAPVLGAIDPDKLRPGFNLFSKEQDVQLGKEAAAQVRQQYQEVRNPELENYIRRVGERIAAAPEARNSGFPFSFTPLNSKEVNAFALPGGPTFVFSGLVREADNEAQLAGVLAHELSHVILRHGTNQASKANLVQLPAMLAGAVVGNGSILGQLSQLGIGLGANSLLLKFSRTAESQADALGAKMMAEAGYNPIEMARFFEKLEASGGSRGPEFLSDHPNPGNRVKAIEELIQQFPRAQYAQNIGDFEKAKQLVSQLPPAPEPRSQRAGAPRPSPSADGSGMQQVQTQNFALSYPSGWQAFGDQNSSMITIAPREGLVQTGNGGVQVGYGAMASYYFPESGRGNNANLKDATQELIQHLHGQNPSLRPSSGSKKVRVDGQQGMITNLTSDSPFGSTERDVLLTVSRPEGLFYLVFVAPENQFGQLQGTFNEMLNSIRFR